MAYSVPLSHHAEHFGWRGNRGPNDSPVHEDDRVTYSVPLTERLLNAKHFSRLPLKSVARQEALWQDTLREGSVRALCQGREYNSSGLTCHLKEAVRARNSIEPLPSLTPRSKNGMRIQLPKPRANRTTTGGTCKRAQTKNQADFPIGRKTKRNSSGKWELLRSSVHRKRVPHLS